MAILQDSDALYDGDGVTKTFAVPFPYLNEQELIVRVDNVITPYVINTPNTVTLAQAPRVNGEVYIYRDTDGTEPRHQFQHGSPLLPRNLDKNFRQVLYVVQEVLGYVNTTADRLIDLVDRTVIRLEQKVQWVLDETTRIVEETIEDTQRKVDAVVADVMAQTETRIREAVDRVLNALRQYTSLRFESASFSITEDHIGKWVRLTTTTGQVLEVTIPDDAGVPYLAADEIFFEQVGTGQSLFVPAEGVTLNVVQGSAPVLGRACTVAGLKKTSANEWTLYGSLEDA